MQRRGNGPEAPREKFSVSSPFRLQGPPMSNAAPVPRVDTRRDGILSVALVVAFAVAGMASLRGGDAPSPKGADAPPTEYSAHRARATLARILGDQAPHP